MGRNFPPDDRPSYRGESIYNSDEYLESVRQARRDSRATPVGAFDPFSGEVVFAEGWQRRVGGWRPLSEWLEGHR